MSGGITQLISTGKQDQFITGNPEVSFFVSTYKRHTNFSQVTDSLIISGNPHPGNISTVRLERKGDLVNHMFLTLNDGTKAVKRDWSNIINKVELMIGGQVIDTQDYTFSSRLAPDLFAQNLSKSYLGSHYSGACFKPVQHFALAHALVHFRRPRREHLIVSSMQRAQYGSRVTSQR